MNRIQGKDHKINKQDFFVLFDDKIYIKSNGSDRLALGYES